MRTAILGVGNLLLKDEGIGVHVAQACARLSLPEEVEVIDGGTSIELAHLVEGFDKMIVIDAASAGGKPGQIYHFTLEEIEQNESPLLSGHEFGIARTLSASALGGKSPRTVLVIGVEPKEIDWGLELSPELENKIPEIVKHVLREIEPGGGDARK